MISYTITTSGHVGDVLCMISAAHTFARLSGHAVFVSQFPDVVACYRDNLLKSGQRGVKIALDVEHLHRLRDGHKFVNYLGTFLQPLLPFHPMPMAFELPGFSTGPKRCLIQPLARTARNPPLAFLQELVNDFHCLTGEQLFAIGHPSTPKTLTGVDYGLLADSVPALMRHIFNAKCVLTPRSASAHIAAAYGIPSFLWLPDDAENWHLTYDNWPHHSTQMADGIEGARERLRLFWSHTTADVGHAVPPLGATLAGEPVNGVSTSGRSTASRSGGTTFHNSQP
jgi:hypothetical protein